MQSSHSQLLGTETKAFSLSFYMQCFLPKMLIPTAAGESSWASDLVRPVILCFVFCRNRAYVGQDLETKAAFV